VTDLIFPQSPKARQKIKPSRFPGALFPPNATGEISGPPDSIVFTPRVYLVVNLMKSPPPFIFTTISPSLSEGFYFSLSEIPPRRPLRTFTMSAYFSRPVRIGLLFVFPHWCIFFCPNKNALATRTSIRRLPSLPASILFQKIFFNRLFHRKFPFFKFRLFPSRQMTSELSNLPLF